MANLELLIGADAFRDSARAAMVRARRRVLVQAMTFEGDAAGLSIASAIGSSPAADRRVLVDDYTRRVINDAFLAFSPDPALKAEAKATWAMFDALVLGGAGLRITNPMSRNPLSYARRNHKKLLVIDDAAWIGGINFSDHNFAWHDMMLRIEDPAAAEWLAGQFDRDWNGAPGAAQAEFAGGIALHSLDGKANAAALRPVLALIANARSSIELVSAYATFPFIDAMAAAARRGVRVNLYTPRPSNKPIVRDYLLGEARRSEMRIMLTGEMSHVKAMLIDGEVLVAGSCNFDFVAHRCNAEYVATIRDPALIADFEARLLAPLRASVVKSGPDPCSPWRSLVARMKLKFADAVIARVPHRPGAVDWADLRP